MTQRLYLFALWCLLVFAGSAITSYYAWSPFSDQDRGGAVAVRGPTHK